MAVVINGVLQHSDPDVPPDVKAAAEATARLVSKRLGITKPEVRWLPSWRDIRGLVEPKHLDTVWVRAGQSPEAVVETTAHECRHAWQLSEYRWTQRNLDSMTKREDDARRYGLEIRAELVDGHLPDADREDDKVECPYCDLDAHEGAPGTCTRAWPTPALDRLLDSLGHSQRGGTPRWPGRSHATTGRVEHGAPVLLTGGRRR